MSQEFLQITQDSRHTFFTLLRTALKNDEFLARVAVLLDNDPYFLPAYLEHIWLAEMRGDVETEQAVLKQAHSIISQILSDSKVRLYVNEKWSKFEVDALHELFDLLQRHKKSLALSTLVSIERWLAGQVIKPKTVTQNTEDHVRLIKHLDVTALRDELRGAAPYWWNVSTTRAEKISYHKHTHSFMLRFIPEPNLDYTPIDGVHESKQTFFAERFPHTHATVLSIAHELNIGLGRVAVVRLPAWSQAYRHYDAEWNYEGRNRYHLVIEASDQNILSSGDETVTAKVGDLWYFDNKVMHRAHNKSSVPRTHIIFDGYPLI